MHADPAAQRGDVDGAGKLGAKHDGQPRRTRLDGLGPAAGGVVVGERDDVETGLGGLLDDRRGCVSAVRGGRMGVQIDAQGSLLACPQAGLDLAAIVREQQVSGVRLGA
jgi:hypothetical protein